MRRKIKIKTDIKGDTMKSVYQNFAQCNLCNFCKIAWHIKEWPNPLAINENSIKISIST